VHRSTEAAVAGHAAGAVGSGQPADQADGWLRHSRHSAVGQATPAEQTARACVSGHPTHRIGVDGRWEGHQRTRVALRYERERRPPAASVYLDSSLASARGPGGPDSFWVSSRRGV
jgi:hypothetical protein